MLFRTRHLTSGVVLLLLAGVLPVFAAQSPERRQAFDTLVSAYAAYRGGREEEGRAGILQALYLDPDLAYANIVRGEVALQEQDWPTAEKYFERGLVLLSQPDQPVTPPRTRTIAISDIEGDTRCFLGYVYIKRAEQASQGGRDREEQRYLELAHRSLKAGLTLTPDDEARQLCERLLRMFRLPADDRAR